MIRPSTRGIALVVALTPLVVAGCTGNARGREGDAARPGDRAATVDPAAPLGGLAFSADAVASRIGSFSWEGVVSWDVQKPGAAPVHSAERHRVRQLASGEFEVSSEIDPGGGPGSVTGRTVIWKGGMTYARSRWAPFRERPTDRGEGARRFRDDSFQVGNDVARLLGPALAAQASGTTTAAGRPARRYTLSLTSATAPSAETGATEADKDPDTARRRAFLAGRVPTAASGELLVDSASGVPLSIALRASFTERGDPQLKAEVSIDARVTALGHEVAAVRTPHGVLPDDRKPKGVARALEAAGLRKRGAGTTPGAPAEDEEEPDEQ